MVLARRRRAPGPGRSRDLLSGGRPRRTLLPRGRIGDERAALRNERSERHLLLPRLEQALFPRLGRDLSRRAARLSRRRGLAGVPGRLGSRAANRPERASPLRSISKAYALAEGWRPLRLQIGQKRQSPFRPILNPYALPSGLGRTSMY